MVTFLASTLAIWALLSHTSAAARSFTNFPSEFKVGQLVTLTWEINPGESVGRLTLQHEHAPGEVLQYETICQWDDARGLNGKGEGVTSIDWVPNVAGPTFHLILNDNGIYSPQFSILAADGTPVTTVPTNIDHFSNIMPQTATPIWYPNDPHQVATSTTIAQSSSTPTTPAAASTTSADLLSTLSTVLENTSPVSITAPSSLSPVLPESTSTSISSTSTSSYRSSTSSYPTNTTAYPPAPTTTLFTSSILPLPNVTSTQQGNTTMSLATQKPTQVFTNAAGAIKSRMGAAVMAVAGCALTWAVL